MVREGGGVGKELEKEKKLKKREIRVLIFGVEWQMSWCLFCILLFLYVGMGWYFHEGGVVGVGWRA